MKNNLSSAKNYGFRLLKIRPRSEFELRQKLSRKKVDKELIEAALSYFKNLNLINDREFARFWISSRIIRPLGMRRLFYELKLKGIDAKLFQEVGQEFKGSVDETEVVRELAQAKLKRLREKDKFKAKQKIYAFLMRRGFSFEAIQEALRGL